MAVVDASVVIKWFANENYSRESLILKEAYVKGLEDLSAPCILPFEVLNGLKYTYNLGEKELEEVGKILTDFQITLYGFEDMLSEIIPLSSKYGITIYDAAYIALGKVLGDKVYTADEKLLRKVKELHFIIHIKDFK
ncbi:MAG: type II toxin-antitoxin system VapC family toxin [Saccharolobus sp.]|uniref:Toxin 1, PIN domain n=2 Tax=Saccharolobus shibatae TaxID=2286 RepID=A0A8F5GYC8_9CREN|nr:type II toxin-antitoxin system VapC family toxin [Saccharolobus shibatae]MCH4816280.1 type II toxin-antitoxin system VapC family toxin [Saccharolobus shibatae]QXJ27600.1 Toxin 1, PIN domain [Saccharolobus shibatae B12]QXJ30910.1 Toxin 1, PIN domain [Saccharolobus shibatae]QXJ33945.1 Toxin 1, PIN domain [Saccharolobus shibatae]